MWGGSPGRMLCKAEADDPAVHHENTSGNLGIPYFGFTSLKAHLTISASFLVVISPSTDSSSNKTDPDTGR